MLKDVKFPVLEIFDSIQGEGYMLGQPATFVRLLGCNLKCPWCDTKTSWISNQTNISAQSMRSIEEIVSCCNLEMVVITGGEPCIHPDLYALVEALKQKQHYVALETNGTLPTPTNIDWVTASPKPEDYIIHPDCHFNELKYVVTRDMCLPPIVLPALLKYPHAPVWLQPNGYDMEYCATKAAEFVKHANRPNLRLGVQLHKIFNFR